MPDETAHWEIPYGLLADPPDGASQVEALADWLDSNPHGRVAMAQQGTLANRPVSTPANPGKRDRRYLVVGDPDPAQNGIEYIDTGTSWIAVAATIPPSSIDTAEIADGAVTNPKIANGIDGAKLSALSVPTGALADKAVTSGKVADALKPSAGAGAGVEALRALGTGAGQALAGDATSAFGRSLIDDLDAAAARQTLGVFGAAAPTAEGQLLVGEADGSPSWQERAWQSEVDAGINIPTGITAVNTININLPRPALIGVSWRGQVNHGGGATMTVRLVTGGAVAVSQSQNANIEHGFGGGTEILVTQGFPADIVSAGGAGGVALNTERVPVGEMIYFKKSAGAHTIQMEAFMSSGNGSISFRRLYVVVIAAF